MVGASTRLEARGLGGLISLRDSRRGDSRFALGSSRYGQKIFKNKMRRIQFATVWRHREFLRRPAGRHSAIFVFYMHVQKAHAKRPQTGGEVTTK